MVEMDTSRRMVQPCQQTPQLWAKRALRCW